MLITHDGNMRCTRRPNRNAIYIHIYIWIAKRSVIGHWIGPWTGHWNAPQIAQMWLRYLLKVFLKSKKKFSSFLEAILVKQKRAHLDHIAWSTQVFGPKDADFDRVVPNWKIIGVVNQALVIGHLLLLRFISTISMTDYWMGAESKR